MGGLGPAGFFTQPHLILLNTIDHHLYRSHDSQYSFIADQKRSPSLLFTGRKVVLSVAHAMDEMDAQQ